ncbi:hypothetical protein GKC29_04950 [Micromonospora sp. WMMC415]|nr:hypothetical protein GKC29_04950 [Micromonospora sp. WMMC415]
MLQPDDLPDGFAATESDLDGDWSLESVTIYCTNRSPSLLVGEVGRRGMEYNSPTEIILERVTRHSGDDAVTVMANVRQLVRGCDLLPPDSSISILAEGLGGADSLLVGAEIDGIPNRWLFVRQGDLVAQLDLEYQTTEADARPVARKVAARLCTGTDAC